MAFVRTLLRRPSIPSQIIGAAMSLWSMTLLTHNICDIISTLHCVAFLIFFIYIFIYYIILREFARGQRNGLRRSRWIRPQAHDCVKDYERHAFTVKDVVMRLPHKSLSVVCLSSFFFLINGPVHRDTAHNKEKERERDSVREQPFNLYWMDRFAAAHAQ